MSVPAREAEPLSLDEVKEQLVVKGRERGFVTSEDLLEAVPVDDFTQEQVEEFLTQVQEHLTAEGVEVIEVPGDDTDIRRPRHGRQFLHRFSPRRTTS